MGLLFQPKTKLLAKSMLSKKSAKVFLLSFIFFFSLNSDCFRKVFENNEDAKRILREMILMKRLNHENVIRLIDLIPPEETSSSFEEIYIVQVFF